MTLLLWGCYLLSEAPEWLSCEMVKVALPAQGLRFILLAYGQTAHLKCIKCLQRILDVRVQMYTANEAPQKCPEKQEQLKITSCYHCTFQQITKGYWLVLQHPTVLYFQSLPSGLRCHFCDLC